MSGVKIFDKIVVDEPQNVQTAVYNLTGKKVEFELIRKFILNEKNTMFYLDKKLNSFMDAEHHTDYLWLDTGFRDKKDDSILICLHKGYDGYVGHYTVPIRELLKYMKTFHKKNMKDIEKNYSRFVTKYKSKIGERENVFINDPEEYVIRTVNRDFDSEETAFALALKNSGIQIEKAEEVIENPMEEAKIPEEKISEAENEITVGLLVDQMESMQKYIDELLERIEKHEKTSKEEIKMLNIQNQEYKKALVDIRLFNAENKEEIGITDEERVMGHKLLGKNKKILVLGNTDIKIEEMRAIGHHSYGFEKDDFEFITDYEKIKATGRRVHGSNRFAAVIFGNCPHKVIGMGNYKSIIDEFKQREDCPISIDARNEAGGLKITKQSFRNALSQIYKELKCLPAA